MKWKEATGIANCVQLVTSVINYIFYSIIFRNHDQVFFTISIKKKFHTKQLDDTGKFIFLSRNENETMTRKFSEYVYELFNERYRISNFIT